MKIKLGELDKAIKALKDYKLDIEDKTERLRDLVAQYIRTEAVRIFNYSRVDTREGLLGFPYKPDVKVSVSNRGDVTVVIAEGKDVVFVEFGAGVYANAKPSPHPLGSELGMTIGSYGKGQGNKTTWGFKNADGKRELTHGTPATMPMYNAMTTVANDIGKLVREVFG